MITMTSDGAEAMVISNSARRYRLRMQVRAWRHELSLGGWFMALVGVVLGILAAVIVYWLEGSDAWQSWCADSYALSDFCTMSSDLTFQISLGVAVGIIGIVGVVFSILLVSLQLVSGQFSPRLLQMVFQERRARVLVASLAGIFSFSMVTLILAVVLVEGDEVPGLGGLLTALAGLFSGVLLVVLLYGIARQQYIGTILEKTAETTISIIDGMNRRAKSDADQPEGFDPAWLKRPQAIPDLGERFTVPALESGWVQQISLDGLLRAAPTDCVLEVQTRVGAFVVEGGDLVVAWPRNRNTFKPEEERALRDVVRLAVYVGTGRTMQDDVDFGIRQIVDVGLRALSPAVNDPTTAVEAILRLADLLRRIITGGLPKQVTYNRESRVLVLHSWDLDAGEYVRHAFSQIRAAGAEHPAIVICLLRTYRMLGQAIQEMEEQLSSQPLTVGVSHRWHLQEARVELDRQQALTVEQFRATRQTQVDYDYVMSALAPDGPA